MSILDFFKSRADQPVFSKDATEIRRVYEFKRWSVFLSVLFGYGLFYTTRQNFSMAKKQMLEAQVMSATEMGTVGFTLLIVYAVGKLINGFLADRCNIARFMSTGLLLSAGANLALGFNPIYTVFLVLWGLNGWFQSVGSAPSVVALSHGYLRASASSMSTPRPGLSLA